MEMPKDLYLIKQAFKNLNEMKKLQTQEEIERDKGNNMGADRYELNKLKTQGKLELTLRSLQHELYRNHDQEEESNDED